MTILHELMDQTTIPLELKDLVTYFSNGFKICAENRHAIMHSHSGGIFTSQTKGTHGLVLTKFTRAGKEQVCLATLEELRTVADDIHRYVMFGATIAGKRADREEKSTFVLVPLHDKPPLPTVMNWQSPDIALAPQPQPGPSGK